MTTSDQRPPRTRAAIVPVVIGAILGALLFLLASQVSSSWFDATTDGSRAVTLVLAALLTAAAVVLGGRYPGPAVAGGSVMVVLIVIGAMAGHVTSIQGPLSLWEPWALAQHGGRSIFVVALTAAVLAQAVERMRRTRR